LIHSQRLTGEYFPVTSKRRNSGSQNCPTFPSGPTGLWHLPRSGRHQNEPKLIRTLQLTSTRLYRARGPLDVGLDNDVWINELINSTEKWTLYDMEIS